MKKMFKMLVMALVMALGVSTMAFADNVTPAQQLQQKLIALGVPNSYIGNVVEYLQKIEITQAQADSILAKVDEAERLLNGQTDLSKLDKATKEAIQSLATEAAAVIGLNLTFGKDAKGDTTATLTDANGKVILALSTADVRTILNNINLDSVKDVIVSVVEFSNNPEKDKFDPISGDLNNTGTNAGMVMVAGFGLMALAGVMFVGSKKVFA